ncbi:PREDICTED: uncharacterized protein LOC105137626 [Populus euphratica]|uniref:Uncharacterized protein LOC105137626 n=1 Tax=Populus euphratica TaxID=75702 RepID=A0AAJ6V721_POPEU|nr:PREDICTED: uncharacterized protein LOC105137626 [Populus euphratica]
MEYRGLIHQHPLMKNEVTFVLIRCEACGEFFQGTTSTCSECAFNIHESCVEFPQEFQDPYHQHRLTLVKTNGMDHLLIKCLVYSENHFGFSFHCQNCNFDLDLKRAFQKLAIIEGYVENPPLARYMAAISASSICTDHCTVSSLPGIPRSATVSPFQLWASLEAYGDKA